MSAALAISVGAGVFMLYCFGIFIDSIAADFGWSRSSVSFGLTWFLIANGIGTILLGTLISRWGVRLPSICFIIVFSFSVTALGLIPPSQFLYYSIFFIIGLSGAAATPMPYSVSICGLFNRRRGLALGLAIGGSGIGGILVPQASNFLLNEIGWRNGLFTVGIIFGLIPLLGLIFLVKEPSYSPANTADVRNTTPDSIMPSSWKDYFKQKEFWCIAIPIFGISVATIGVLSILVPIMTDRGVSPTQAATMLTVAGFCSWMGKYFTGYFLDKFFAPYIAASIFSLVLIGLIMVLLDTPGLITFIAVGFIGLGIGAEGDLVTFMTSRYFHMKDYSRVIGVMWIMWAWGGGLGTFLTGVSMNITSTYTASFIMFLLLMIISIFSVLRLGPYLNPIKHA